MCNNPFTNRNLFLHLFSIATDINPERLEKAKQMGADLTVNGANENLKEIGNDI